MNRMRYRAFFLSALTIFVLFLSCPAGSEPLKKGPDAGKRAEMVIKSDKLEVDDKQKVVIFTGGVRAKRDDLVINCQKLVVFYESLPVEKSPGESKTRIDRIVATGDVRIDRAQGGKAFAQKAVYYQQDEKVVLTENPVVKKESDFVEGDKITLYLKENRSIVESSGEGKVKAVIFPNKEKN
jgi:lipopolysaccharide export system protein LptA